MTRCVSLLPAVLTLTALSFGCQSSPSGPAAEPAKADKPEVAQQDAPAATAPHGADPHATAPHGADPHGAVGSVKTREPVNPQAVTPSGTTREEAVAGLKYKVPEEWVKKAGSSPMRLAEYTLPGPGGEAELVLYRFAGGGGDAKSNIHRWRTQFSKADGTPLGDDDGEVKESERGPLKLTLVDLAGTYVAAVTPGAAERYSDPNYRMLAAIVEGSGDPYFFKAVGPAATLELWKPSFVQLGESITVE